MTRPLIYADFHNTDAAGRVRLNSVGTTEDLARLGIPLADGLLVTLYTDDGDRADGLQLDGAVTKSAGENCWVVVVDWSTIRRTPAPIRMPTPSPTSESVSPVTAR